MSLKSNVPRDYKESKLVIKRIVYTLLSKSLDKLKTATARSSKAFCFLNAIGILVLHRMKDIEAICLETIKNQS